MLEQTLVLFDVLTSCIRVSRSIWYICTFSMLSLVNAVRIERERGRERESGAEQNGKRWGF